MISNVWTDIEAAVEEGHFIQNQLSKTAYLACDMQRNLYVFTHEELKAFKKKLKILEIFHPGGRLNEHKRLLSSYT
jgi:DNA-binding transcriptional regulator/RsmH inhibitor MraZ